MATRKTRSSKKVATPARTHTKFSWFKPSRFAYRPASDLGWLISFSALAIAALALVRAIQDYHSVLDAVYTTIPTILAMILILYAVARSTSRQP